LLVSFPNNLFVLSFIYEEFINYHVSPCYHGMDMKEKSNVSTTEG